MKTLLISSHDTATGKTWTARNLVHYFFHLGLTVQMVKPIETGANPLKEQGDAHFSTHPLLPSTRLSAYTLHSFKAPIGPVHAAQAEGISLSVNKLTEEILALPEADIRLIEGAGGLACPIDSTTQEDYKDLALKLQVDGLILVIENRLGAMNQARLLTSYAPTMSIPTGLWVNTVKHQPPQVHTSNMEVLSTLGLPIWGELAPNTRYGEPKTSFKKQFTTKPCLA